MKQNALISVCMILISANAWGALELTEGAGFSEYVIPTSASAYSRAIRTCSVPMIEDNKILQTAALSVLRAIAKNLDGMVDETRRDQASNRIEEEKEAFVAKAREFTQKYGMAECEYFEGGQYLRIQPEKIANLGKTPPVQAREQAEVECSEEMKADHAEWSKRMLIPLNQMAVLIGRMMNKSLDGQPNGLEREMLIQAEQSIIDLGREFRGRYAGTYLCNVTNEAGEKHSVSSRELDQLISKAGEDQRKLQTRLSRHSFGPSI